MRSNAFKTCVGIFMEGFFKEFYFLVSCINCYGAYCNREVHWNIVEVSGFLNYPNIIMVGDINFTLLEAEVWGYSVRSDRTGFFSLNFFYDMGF